jgi:4-hydroxythreonine-4-phosphate dehydrogenase
VPSQPLSKPLAITSGEPAGIGPDICLKAYLASHNPNWVVVGDVQLLKERAAQLGLTIQVSQWQAGSPVSDDKLNVMHVPLKVRTELGKLNPDNATYVLQTLNLAADGCTSGLFSGMVTAPVQKSIINDAGYAFSGHTEYLAERVGGYPVMMLTADGLLADQKYTMRVALATTHLPLRDVADAVTANTLTKVLEIIDRDLKQRFGLAKPKILVCGLNPHAGENGHLGSEELEVIIPTLKKLRADGINLVGPLPADTLFIPRHLLGADAILAMYHDQGLPVLKHYGFGNGTNITLGLPIIRTSVDHGTALDLAGSGKADHRSMETAISTAQQMSTS